jgi:hypothetical protein
VRDLQISGGIDHALFMRHLKKITLEYWDTEGNMALGRFLPFLSIPSVRTFWAKMVGSDGTWIATAHRFPHIKELSLKSANLDHDLLRQFLLSFPNLEKLYYRSGLEDPTLEPPRFLAALEHLRPSLRELSLFNQNYIDGSGIEEFPIGSLTGFAKLETVNMDSTILTGAPGPERVIDGFHSRQSLADTLPTRLCHLQLSNCLYDRYLPSRVATLISRKPTTFPHLKTLNLEWERIEYPDKPSPSSPHKHPGFEREAALQLLEKMEAMDVKMVMPSKPPEPKFLYYMKENEGSENGIFGSIRVSHSVEYPYEDYERLCEEHGCDLVTGKGPGLFW